MKISGETILAASLLRVTSRSNQYHYGLVKFHHCQKKFRNITFDTIEPLRGHAKEEGGVFVDIGLMPLVPFLKEQEFKKDITNKPFVFFPVHLEDPKDADM